MHVPSLRNRILIGSYIQTEWLGRVCLWGCCILDAAEESHVTALSSPHGLPLEPLFTIFPGSVLKPAAIFRQDVPWFRLQRRAEPTTGRTRHLTGACVAVLCSGDELALCGMKAIGSIWLNSWPRDLFALLSLQKLLGPGIGAPLKNPRCFTRCVCQTKMDRFHF